MTDIQGQQSHYASSREILVSISAVNVHSKQFLLKIIIGCVGNISEKFCRHIFCVECLVKVLTFRLDLLIKKKKYNRRDFN